ncbi:SMP-30/gluconolactonase/LRE family protein [Gordonia sp. OPL2]|uniref:SMP-30/gluconolactonase/LRE family protein n=1 Tax=Gordonia sp. OPL2 TaxID=2486274 RepID=UPI001655EA8C|nr:SMP-30/gluconolactonase/LRE family protein [Gordonia sp. OPL2]ROZ99029.1 SMP-30/gluconolactonase/LRE family protein [Gordonia sp. OPL2]
MIESLPEPSVLLRGRSMVESARWHDGRWWFADWGTGEVIAVDTSGVEEVVTTGPPPPRMGWSIEWSPTGQLLTTGPDVRVHAPGSAPTVWSDRGGNEIVVAPQGHVYVNGADFDFVGGGQPVPGWISLIEPDGRHRQVAGDIDFPNGMVITPDGATLVIAESMGGRLTAFDIADDGSLTGRRIWAEGLGPDGICIDADGGIWAQTADTAAHTGDPAAPGGACVRVLDGGEITHRVETDLPCFSCALGGDGGPQMLLLCNEFGGVDQMVEVQARRSARVLVVDAPVARAS